MVVVPGDDIATAGGAFKATEGLLGRFGPTGVRDIPNLEMGSLEAAMAGLRQVVEMMYVEVIGVALNQPVTGAAKMHYLSHGTLRVPLVMGDFPILVVHGD